MDLPRRCLLTGLVLAAFAACGEGNFEPVNPQPLVPPDIYRLWWDEMQTCTGIAAPFGRVAWFQADRLINRETGTQHAGAWIPPHTIYVLSRHLLHARAVKHEMAHELLQRRDHESDAFERCAGF